MKLTITKLPANELVSLTKVNAFFYECIIDDYIWRKLFIQQLGNAPILSYINQQQTPELSEGNVDKTRYFMLYFYCHYLKILYEFIMDDSCNNQAYCKNFVDIFVTVKNFLKINIDNLIEQVIEISRHDALAAILFFKPTYHDKVKHLMIQQETTGKHKYDVMGI